jgi:hypothetical protein
VLTDTDDIWEHFGCALTPGPDNNLDCDNAGDHAEITLKE